MFFLFLRFPLPGYSMPMGINLSSALPLDQRRVNSLNVQSYSQPLNFGIVFVTNFFLFVVPNKNFRQL